ncbi:MAG: hypothetical protein HDR06_05360 [Lachnospiraceae bacterium]|nr:hypothetical protein [Lachnospiraceae bacterium]
MRYIALFFPAIISVGIEYKKNNGEKWNWFEYIYKYAFFLISNVFLTESLVTYIFKMGAVTIDAFDSFPFFTKYILAATVFAVILPAVLKIIRANISFSFELHKK